MRSASRRTRRTALPRPLSRNELRKLLCTSATRPTFVHVRPTRRSSVTVPLAVGTRVPVNVTPRPLMLFDAEALSDTRVPTSTRVIALLLGA